MKDTAITMDGRLAHILINRSAYKIAVFALSWWLATGTRIKTFPDSLGLFPIVLPENSWVSGVVTLNLLV
jgi:hypothetical protein